MAKIEEFIINNFLSIILSMAAFWISLVGYGLIMS